MGGVAGCGSAFALPGRPEVGVGGATWSPPQVVSGYSPDVGRKVLTVMETKINSNEQQFSNVAKQQEQSSKQRSGEVFTGYVSSRVKDTGEITPAVRPVFKQGGLEVVYLTMVHDIFARDEAGLILRDEASKPVVEDTIWFQLALRGLKAKEAMRRKLGRRSKITVAGNLAVKDNEGKDGRTYENLVMEPSFVRYDDVTQDAEAWAAAKAKSLATAQADADEEGEQSQAPRRARVNKQPLPAVELVAAG